MDNRILECVPNFSEGNDPAKIERITAAIRSIAGARLLHVDSGKATNRTVVTFVGAPEAVVEAAFQAIRAAAEVIDMSFHTGAHPRLGATDVCPLIPVSGITMEEAVQYAKALGKRVGEELRIPVYLYEQAALLPERKNLATIRSGEYEGLAVKLKDPGWLPDYGKAVFNPRSGATVIGARNFLIAYNVNLNTRSVKKANAVAFDLRENGRIKTESGKPVLDELGQPVRIPGRLTHVKAIGWYIEEYGIAQVSMNLTSMDVTPVHIAFEEACIRAQQRGMRVTGSELVGMIPLRCLIDAGKFYLKKQGRSAGVSESELVQMAIHSMGLDDLGPFDPAHKIIEYAMAVPSGTLQNLSLQEFCDELASESYAPGGGSVSALLGALAAALATMVANLSASRKNWEDRLEFFSVRAEKGQLLKDQLLRLVQEDSNAFRRIIAARAMPKQTDEEKKTRESALMTCTTDAVKVPLDVMEISCSCFDLIHDMVSQGNPNAVSDGGVAALCAKAAVHGAYLNVQINAISFPDREIASRWMALATSLLDTAISREKEILRLVQECISSV
jgi:glutamate formiminotransferase/formiminotetrahydrofolate cyclodeaminase